MEEELNIEDAVAASLSVSSSEDTNPDKFVELAACEEESTNYLTQLEKEKEELRSKLAEAMKKRRELKMKRSTLEAKISTHKDMSAAIQMKELMERKNYLKTQLDDFTTQIEEIRMESFILSQQELNVQILDSTEVEQRLRGYMSPQIVENSLKTKQIQKTQAKEKIESLKKQMMEVDRRIREMRGQSRVAKTMAVLNVKLKKKAAELGEKKMHLNSSIKLLNPVDEEVFETPIKGHPRLPIFTRSLRN